MEIAYALIADSANVTNNGKLNVLGAFSVIGSEAFPAFHPEMVLAFSMRAEYDDSRTTHSLTIRLIDEDARELLRMPAAVEVAAIAPGEFSQIVQVVRIVGFRIPRKGRYRFLIQIDEQEPFPVVLMAAQTPEAHRGG